MTEHNPNLYLWSVRFQLPYPDYYDYRELVKKLNMDDPDIRINIDNGYLCFDVQIQEPLHSMNTEKLERPLGDAISLILEALRLAYLGPLGN